MGRCGVVVVISHYKHRFRQHILESVHQGCKNFLVPGTKYIFNSIIGCHCHWSPRSLPMSNSAPEVALRRFNGGLVMSCCRFVLFPQEINILQWEIEFDQDRFKNIEDTWTEKYDRYLTYAAHHWGYFICIECCMLSFLCSKFASLGFLGLCLPNLLPGLGIFIYLLC